MSRVYAHVCDACGTRADAERDPDDRHALVPPAGWAYLELPCGADPDACSAACAKRVLDAHDGHAPHDAVAAGAVERPS